jgi:hypothetical protein
VGIVGWLMLVLGGREHALQAVGLHLACVHPVVAEQQRAAERAPEQRASQHSTDDDDDCPPGCTDCACGAAPFVPAVPVVMVGKPYLSERDYQRPPTTAGPSCRGLDLERPPRA